MALFFLALLMFFSCCCFTLRFGCVQRKKVPKPAFVGKQIQELGIGTFRNIATVRQTATLYDAFSVFVERRVSALPVVDDQGVASFKKKQKRRRFLQFKNIKC